MSKSKVKKWYFLRKMIQKGYVLICIFAILFASIGSSQALVTDTLGSPAVVTNTSIINASYQLNSTPAAFSALNQSTIPVNITSTGIINSTTDNNALYSAVLANNKTLFTDIALASVNGAISGLASVNIQQNSAITAFSQVSGTSVTSTLTNPAAGSSASLSGNSISADTTLNQTSQTAQGKINPTFDSSIAGTALLQPANPQLSGDAGLFVGSFQHNNVISSTVMGDPFAQITGTNSIALTATGTLGSNLNLMADGNSISAAFTGNNAENLLAVQTGGANSLTSSAGIANLQINSNYDYQNPPNISAIIAAGSSISASVQPNALTSSTLWFDGNQLEASATGSASINELQVAANLNVAADGAQTNSLNFTAGSETATTSGGLFLNNMQLNAIAPISATATDPAGAAAALSVDSRGLISSVLTADGNSFEAIALGNDAYGSISVGGATSFNSAVAASNLQTVNLSSVSATANGGTLAVNLGGSPALVDVTANDIIGATISVSDNAIGALAVANRDPLLVSITGNMVTDGLIQTADTSVNNGTQALSSTAGVSAISSQFATGSNVTATNTGAGINLAAGGYPVSTGAAGPRVSDTTFTQSGNSLSSLANLNEGLVAAGIGANVINASSAVASVQNATTSNATATTSGTITTGVNTRISGLPGIPTDISVLVGDNTISSIAGGNLNATALEAMATTNMQVTNVIDMNGLTSNVLSLSSDAAAINSALAEMSVLTDQRLDVNSITATTDYSQITGIIRRSADAISNSTLNVDGNNVNATARGNLTGNSLNFSALSVDMSAAEFDIAGSTPAGSNLASTGAVQVIGGQSSVTATINAGAGADASNAPEILGFLAGSGDLTNIELSVNGNSVVAAATGNDATSSLNGSGGSLAQDVPNSLSGTISIGATPATALSINDTAIANAVVQSNAGSVSASLATTQNYQIIARTQSNNTLTNNSTDITNSVITADNNRAIAIATGSSANAGTALAFNTLESSAATAVQQDQSGSTTATVGGVGGVTIAALIPLNTNLVGSPMSASGNTAGAQAIGATSASSLTASGNTLRSGYGDTAVDGASAQLLTLGGTQTSGDYMLSVQQDISGATSASADDLSVYVQGARLAGGSLTADNNFLTAQATGGISQGPLDSKGVPTAATLSLTANDMTAGGNAENTVDAVLSSDQRLSAPVVSTLTASDVTVTATNLTTAATGTNNSEAISASKNTLLASGLGLGSTNALTTDAATSVAGDSSGDRTAAFDTGVVAVSGSGWDRLIVSNQEIAAGGTVAVASAATTVAASITGAVAPYSPVTGDINTDSIKVDDNNLLAQGIGATSSNTLSTTAGDAINALSQAILARQSTAGAVLSSNTTVAANLNVAGNSTDSVSSVSGNQLAATATGLSGSNSLSTNSATSITDSIGLSTLTTLILSEQEMLPSAIVTATLSNSQASLGVTASLGGITPGNVDGSTLKVDNNSLLAQATGATSSNNLSTTAGAGISSVSQAIASLQDSEAPVLANSTVTSATLNVAGNSTTSSLSVSGNELAAAADGLNSSNILSQKSSVSIVDDGELVPSGILSVQILEDTAIVQAGLTASQTALGVTGDVTGSTLKVDNNKLLAQAKGATSSNNFSASAGTTIDSVFQGIIALQESDAPVSAINATTAATLNVGGAGTNSSLSVSGNELAATATGLNGSNAASMSSDVSIIDTRVLPPNGIVSIQGLSDTGLVTATLSGPIATLSVTDDVTGSSLKVDNNLQQASAKGSNNTNTLSVESGSFGVTVPESIGLTIYAIQDSEAPVSATNSGAGNFLTIGGAASGDSLVLSGDGISASAGNLSGDNSLTVKAVTANIGDTSTLSYLTGPTASADRLILSTQNVANTSNGDVSATVTDPTMSLSVTGGLSGNSTAYLNSNSIASAATVAANTNTLTNSANTLLTSSALIGSVQISAANATALTDLTNGGLLIDIGIGTSDASVSLANNQVTASATDLTATNTMNVTAGSMQGAIPPALGSITASAPLGVINHDLNSALSAITSEQTTCPNCVVSAEVLNPFLWVTLAGNVTNSAVHEDSNLVQASSMSASTTNTLNQLADTSMSDAPALIAASQVISGSSTATVTGAWIFPNIGGNVIASNLTADNNTIQAVATGGAMKNYLDPGAGTSITANEFLDPAVTTASSNFIGSYGLVSRQTSTAVVTATVDAEPWVELAVGGNITDNSAVSASGNITRAQATNLTTDNSIVTAAATALSGVTSGVLSYQNVAAATSASVTGAQIQLTGGDLTGAANVDSNWLVAIATGGNSTNDLSVSGMSVGGAPVGALSSLATSIAAGPALSAISGDESLASLLNVQSLTGNVTATMDANDAGQGVLASFVGAVTGSVSMNNNIVAAEASGLVANNTLALASKTLIDGGSTALGSVQSSTADITASVTGVESSTGVSLTAIGALTGTATVDANTIQADATANLAINSLSAKAGTAFNLGTSTTTTITAALTDISAGTAGLALQNLQSGIGAVTASIGSADANIAITSAIIGPLNGTATVDNNTVLAQARGQVAQNSLALNAGTSLNASASLANVQTNGGPISSTITNGDISLTTTTVTGTTSVSGNKVQASSTANLALNSMDIAGTLAPSTGGSAGPLTATADYVAFNTQSNTAAVNSNLSNFTIRLVDSASTTGTASVLNNSILADATGNSSTNTFTISPKAGSNTADFAFTGYQSNTGAISSSISGATISLTSAGGTGTFSATGNRIGATSIGNSSISSIKSGK